MIFGASSIAPKVDALFVILVGVSAVVTAAVWILLIYLCVKYRKNSRANRANPPTKSSAPELTLCGIMFVFGLAAFLWSAQIFYQLRAVPSDALDVYVIAKQWMWTFHDSRIGDQINLLRVPQGRAIRLIMTSQDVVHSLFIPDFRVKQDVLPGRYTSLWFQADKLGRFPILCSQYCGLDHSSMRGIVEVIPQSDYDTQTTHPPEFAGQKLYFQKGCASCHEGAHPVGPPLTHLFQSDVALSSGEHIRADENYLRRSILQPNADIVAGYPSVMPTFSGQISEAELIALIDYLKAVR